MDRTTAGEKGVVQMVAMPEKLRALLREWHTVPVATAGKDGKPNVAAKSVMVTDEGNVVWGELYFMQTYRNLTENPRASICVWEEKPPFTAYRIQGRVELHEDDRMAADLDARVKAGHATAGSPLFPARRPLLAAVVFRVEEIYDQTPRLESGGKRIL